MSELPKNILKMMGVLFAVLILSFTGYQTWSLLYEVSKNAITAFIGLALFEGGMLYWWFAFQKEAEGIPQMGLSLMMAVFGLFLVAGATALHLGAVSGELLGANTPARLVTVAAVINLIGKFLFPLVAPEVFEATWLRALEGKVTMAAYKDADSKVDDMAVNLGDQIGAELTRKLQVKMLTHYGLYHDAGRPPVVVEGEAVVVEPTRPSPAPLVPGETDNNFYVAYADGRGWRRTGAYRPFADATESLNEFAASDPDMVWAVLDINGNVCYKIEPSVSPNGSGPG